MTDSISGYILLGSEKIHYLHTGNGSKLLVAFHGYGNHAGIFLPLAEQLKSEYTVISIDLPHHGKSEWPATKYLEIEQAKHLIGELRLKYGVDKVSLLGYSMGGRVCLKIVELIPNCIDKVVLIASDGLRFNTFYYFLTRTISGKGLFKHFLRNPKPYNVFVQWGRKLNLVNATQYKFAMQYISAEQDRDFLLKVWSCMAYLIPDMKKLKQVVADHQIRIVIFMGKYDTVIPVALASGFKEEIPTSDLIVVEKGHKVLDTETIPIIARYILTSS